MEYRERSYTAQDGLRLYFRDYGDPLSPALPLLCLPGLTRNSGDFGTLSRRLSLNRRVLCPDYRGRGRSQYDTDWRNYASRIILNDLLHLLAATNVHRVVVLGTSFGGLLGMGLAVAAPTVLAGLITNDIGPEIDAAETRRLLALLCADRPQPDWDAAAAAVREMFPSLAFRDPDNWQRMARNTYRKGADGMLHFDWDPALTKQFLRNGEPPDLWRLFRAAARIPMLAVRGENSPMLSRSCFDTMAAEKPDLVRLTVTGTGHAPTLDEPEARAAIDAFLDRL